MKNELFKLRDGAILNITENCSSVDIAETNDDWTDYATLNTTDILVSMTNYTFIITLKNMYTEPEYTMSDLIIELNHNTDYIKELQQSIFVQWIKDRVDKHEKNSLVDGVNYALILK